MVGLAKARPNHMLQVINTLLHGSYSKLQLMWAYETNALQKLGESQTMADLHLENDSGGEGGFMRVRRQGCKNLHKHMTYKKV